MISRNQLFISKSAYKTAFGGQMHNFFLSYDSICVFAVVCENSCKNINFSVDFVYYFAWGLTPFYRGIKFLCRNLWKGIGLIIQIRIMPYT